MNNTEQKESGKYQYWRDFDKDGDIVLEENRKIFSEILGLLYENETNFNKVKDRILLLKINGELIDEDLIGYIYFSLMTYASFGMRAYNLPVLYDNVDIGKVMDYFDLESLELVNSFLAKNIDKVPEVITTIFGNRGKDYPRALVLQLQSLVENNLEARKSRGN